MPDGQTSPVVVVAKPKNMGIGILLAFLFGPFGLLYSSKLGAIVMFIVSIVPVTLLYLMLKVPDSERTLDIEQNIFYVVVIYAISWYVAPAIWAAIAVSARNEKLQERSRLS